MTETKTYTTSATQAGRTSKQMANVYWILGLSFLTLVFDGYDLVVYGTVVPKLLSKAQPLGPIDAAQAGVIGSYALIGVMIGALLAGAVGDYIGRRKIILGGIVWFSILMGLTGMATDATIFGILRLITGIGLGALLATLGAMVAEFAPVDKKNLFNAIVYSGIPAGGVLASLSALAFLPVIDWRGMFFLGGTPIFYLLPLALLKLPESPKWLESKGKRAEAEKVAAATGVPIEDVKAVLALETEKVGFAGLFGSHYLVPTILLGFMSFSGLLMTYGLNTWLPKLMGTYGYGPEMSLVFLLLLNGGAVAGGMVMAWAADKFLGPKLTIILTFLVAAGALAGMTFGYPEMIKNPVLFTLIFIAGVGTLGTQVLIYGMVSNYYTTKVRAAGVSWCAGFGRLGGIFGPILGGMILAAVVGGGQAGGAQAFYVFAGVAVFGAIMVALVPQGKSEAFRQAEAYKLEQAELAKVKAAAGL